MRSLRWVGSSREDLAKLPKPVRRKLGHALHVAQIGLQHVRAKPLTGFGGASVVEISADDDGSTYRAVYTLTLPDAIYVLHVFQKKSKTGIATPQKEIDLIHQRLKRAREMHSAGPLGSGAAKEPNHE